MDVRQSITDTIISLLEKGGNVGTQRWTKQAGNGMPTNGKTKQAYRGINTLLLLAAAMEADHPTNTWMTFKQAQEMGGMVRKGSKGVMCAYFEMVKKKDSEVEIGEDGKPQFFPMVKPFWVFNVAQIDGLPGDVYGKPAKTFDFSPIEAAEALLQASGAVFNHGKEQAFYRSSDDQIYMPNKERFTTPENYYATALHELTHWTGAENRLARTFGKRFGDSAYAMEELVAELGSAFLVGHVGFVESTIENHASYLEGWLKVLKADKNAIFTAAKQAGLAYEFVMQKAGLMPTAEANEQA